MEKFEIIGGIPLKGEVKISGAKNAALKAIVAACLTEEEVILKNIPLISDFLLMLQIFKAIGGKVNLNDHKVSLKLENLKSDEIPLEMAARARTTIMFIAPLLARFKKAVIPNPGGCRLGARPVDRLIESLKKLGANINYDSETGYFIGETSGLVGNKYKFEKSSHTGTETLIIAATLACGITIIENAALEPEIDELIELLNKMGADIKREDNRKIVIHGVKKLHGAEIEILPDRNEAVTFALAAIITKGEIIVKDAGKTNLDYFLEALDKVNAGYERIGNDIKFFYKGNIKPLNITTNIHPGFMTDWLAPWSILMTQASGESEIFETVFENKFGYITDLKKMGVKAKLFNPKVENPQNVYNFNLEDDNPEYYHGVKIFGPTKLHNAVLSMDNIRAGAAVVLAALAAKGQSTIFGIDKLDRGYEKFDDRLRNLGANIERQKEE